MIAPTLFEGSRMTLDEAKHGYYACTNVGCGGTFYVDLQAKIIGIAPCIYLYICNRCEKRKSMACQAEVEEIRKSAMSEFENRIPVKRVFTVR